MNTELIKKAKNDFKKYFFQVDEYYSFWKNHRKCEKTQRYQACKNQAKKELIPMRS